MIFSNNSEIELSIPIEDETIWATTKDIANIFNIDRSVVSRHIKNIFKHGALSNKTQTRELKYYNLDIILMDKESIAILEKLK